MPKTLTALPSSQYATILSVVAGHHDAFFPLPSMTLRHAEVVKGDDTDFRTDGLPTCLVGNGLEPDRKEF